MQSGTTLTRGPLPPGVYWRRRLVLLVAGAVLVFVIAQLLSGGSDGKGGGPVAQQAAAGFSTSTGTPSTSTTRTAMAGPTYSAPTGRSTSASPLTLAAPTGPCAPSDITVTPSVSRADAYTDVTINLALQTKSSAACTWDVDQHDIAVKIARHGKVLWTSQQCPSALPVRSVVVRNVVPSIVTMVWNGRVSTVGCRSGSAFVRPGKVYLYGSTLGGEPGHSAFTLALPDAQTVTASPTATATTSATATSSATSTASPKAR